MVKLICYNVEYCTGIQSGWYEYIFFWKYFFRKGVDKKILNALKKLKPDILALIEVDTGSIGAGKNQVDYFEKSLGSNDFIQRAKYQFKGLARIFKHVPILKKQGNALISKYNFSNLEYHYLSKGLHNVVIEATVKCPKKVTLLLAHLTFNRWSRKKQIEELIGIVNGIKNPVILMGDFNTFYGDKELKTLLKKTHLTDMAKLGKKSQKLTFPSWKPSRRLDYVLVSPQIKVNKYEVLNYHFSDHLPLFVEFNVK